MSHPLPIYPQAVFLDLAGESLSVDTQNARRLLALTFGSPKHELDVPLLQLL